jgi:hypothetical protein
MKEMTWSWEDYLATPMGHVRLIGEQLQKRAEADERNAAAAKRKGKH